jgi:uncharacterized membrane protein
VRGEVPVGVPGKHWYVAALGAVVAGLMVAIALVAWAIFWPEDRVQFAAPGSVTVQLRPGGHALWNDYRTTFEGTPYDSPRELPEGFKAVVKDPAGTLLPLRAAQTHELKTQEADRDASRTFIATRAGAHEIAVTGNFTKRIVSVAPYGFWRPFGAILTAILAAMLGLAVGFALWSWTFFRREAALEAAAAPAPAVREDSVPRRLTAIVYALQLAGYFTVVSPLGGIVINYLKRDAVAGTWLESHFDWQIRTFWITLAGLIAGALTLLLFVGWFVIGITLMWFLYRGIKGWIDLSEGKPILRSGSMT